MSVNVTNLCGCVLTFDAAIPVSLIVFLHSLHLADPH